MADNDEFKLDLDVKEFIASATDAKGAIEGLGDAKNLDGLISGLTKVSAVVGVVGVAAFALKATFDTVFEGEQLRRLNTQFETLTSNIGLSARELKEGLVGAARGLADDSQIIEAANKAIVSMGGNAEKLPETMELARKATSVFGGELIDNFEKINQAIATGNTRLLKNMGIVVDTDKAQREYAKSLGISVSELSEAGKKQAVMNAVLEKGQEAFKGITGEVETSRDTFTQLKVTINDIKDTVVLAFEKTMGPTVKKFFQSLSGWAGEFKTAIQAKFGEGIEGADAKTKVLKDRITELKATIIDLEQKQMGNVFDPAPGDTLARMKTAQEELKKLQAEYTAAAGEAQKLNEAQKSKDEQVTAGGVKKDSSVDLDKQRKNQAVFEKEMLKLREDRIRAMQQMSESSVQTDAAFEAQKVVLAKQTEAKIKEIQSSEQLNEKQKNQLILAERQNLALKTQEIEIQKIQSQQKLNQQQIQLADNLTQYENLQNQQRLLMKQEFDAQIAMIEMNKDMTEQQKMLAKQQTDAMYRQQVLAEEENFNRQRMEIVDRWVAHGNNAADQWAKGFARGSMQAQQNLANFGAQGTAVFNMFTNRAANAFIELGEGSKKGSQVVKEAILGMIADVAIYYGTMMLAAGIFPPNPAALAGGAALLVLAGMLKGMVKKSSGMGGVSIPGGGAGEGGFEGRSYGAAPQQYAQQQQRQEKSVSLTIQGNYYETEQTRTRITELVREAMDSTDFTIQRVGGGI